jgi:hypothetical protein
MPAACAPCPPGRFPTDLTDAQWCLLARCSRCRALAWPARPPRDQPPRADQRDLVPAMDRLPVAGLPDRYHWRTVHTTSAAGPPTALPTL